MENNRSHQNSFYSCRTTINVKTLIILGDNEVGKSCIIKSLTKKKFDPRMQTTIGINYSVCKMEIYKEEKITFSIWDTNGSEIKEKILPQLQYKNCDLFIIVISYDKRETLQTLRNYINFISRIHENRNTPIVVITNKSDIKSKKFTMKEVIKSIEEFNMLNIRVSEISCQNINSVQGLFFQIGASLLGKRVHKGSVVSSTIPEKSLNTDSDSIMISLRKSFRIDNSNSMDASSSTNLLGDESRNEGKSKKCCGS